MTSAITASDTARDFASSIVSGEDPGIYYAIGATDTMLSDPMTAEYADGLMLDYLDMKATEGIESGQRETQSELMRYAVGLDDAIVSYAGLDDSQRQRLREGQSLGDTLPTERIVQRFYFG